MPFSQPASCSTVLGIQSWLASWHSYSLSHGYTSVSYGHSRFITVSASYMALQSMSGLFSSVFLSCSISMCFYYNCSGASRLCMDWLECLRRGGSEILINNKISAPLILTSYQMRFRNISNGAEVRVFNMRVLSLPGNGIEILIFQMRETWENIFTIYIHRDVSTMNTKCIKYAIVNISNWFAWSVKYYSLYRNNRTIVFMMDGQTVIINNLVWNNN